MNAIVSFGRNVGNLPMSDKLWLQFQSDVLKVVKKECSIVYFTGVGRGLYESNPEESTTIVAEFTGQMGTFQNALTKLAKKYKQESIALTFGQPIFC